MKNRKTKDLKRVLVKKGFELFPEKDHHEFYYLMINGIKQRVYTYFSHGKSEYGDSLMGQIKKQLKFDTTQNAEDFFDCPMSAEQYIEMLKKNNHVK